MVLSFYALTNIVLLKKTKYLGTFTKKKNIFTNFVHQNYCGESWSERGESTPIANANILAKKLL